MTSSLGSLQNFDETTIRLVVLDTTGPVARLGFEPAPRLRALTQHGLAPPRPEAAENEKPRRRGPAGLELASY